MTRVLADMLLVDFAVHALSTPEPRCPQSADNCISCGSCRKHSMLQSFLQVKQLASAQWRWWSSSTTHITWRRFITSCGLLAALVISSIVLASR